MTNTFVLVAQRASVCSQLLIVNEDWCLEGWPCVRFLSGMVAYRSLYFYALLGRQFALSLVFFSSTWWTALVMINDIDLDKNRPSGRSLLVRWKQGIWMCECNYHEIFEHWLFCFPLLNKRGSLFLLLKEMVSDLNNQAEIPVIAPSEWAAHKYAWKGQWPNLHTNTGDMASSSEPVS